MWSRISNSSLRNIRFLDIFPDGYDYTIIHAVWMFDSICDWLPDCLSGWTQSTEFRKHFLGFVSKCFIEFHYFANSTHLLAFIWHSIQLLWAGSVSHCRRLEEAFGRYDNWFIHSKRKKCSIELIAMLGCDWFRFSHSNTRIFDGASRKSEWRHATTVFAE